VAEGSIAVKLASGVTVSSGGELLISGGSVSGVLMILSGGDEVFEVVSSGATVSSEVLNAGVG